MARYAVSYVSFHDNNLKMELLETTCELDALAYAYKAVFGVDMPSDLDLTPEELQAAAFDMDGLICAIEIPRESQLHLDV